MATKSSDEEIVPVIFRVYKGGDVIAIFPTIPEDHYGYSCTMYQHIGQHGGGDPVGVIRSTRPAKPSEYASLKRELESIGYKLKVHQRMSSEMQAACRAEAKAHLARSAARAGGGGGRTRGAAERVVKLRDQDRPTVLGYELHRESLTPVRTYVDTRRQGDYGADPIGDGNFRMVPSGDIVSFEERNRRLKRAR